MLWPHGAFLTVSLRAFPSLMRESIIPIGPLGLIQNAQNKPFRAVAENGFRCFARLHWTAAAARFSLTVSCAAPFFILVCAFASFFFWGQVLSPSYFACSFCRAHSHARAKPAFGSSVRHADVPLFPSKIICPPPSPTLLGKCRSLAQRKMQNFVRAEGVNSPPFRAAKYLQCLASMMALNPTLKSFHHRTNFLSNLKRSQNAPFRTARFIRTFPG